MKMIEKFMTKNRCFTQNKKIKPIGVMVHSDACKAGVKAIAWFERWNNAITTKAVHYFVDDEEAVKYLHAEKGNVTRGWHCAGKGNDLYIGFEMSEPKDYLDKVYFDNVYANAVDLTVQNLLNVVETVVVNDNTVLCHAEGYKKGLASNHADVFHWFSKQGKDMDDFRKDVRKKIFSTYVPLTTINKQSKKMDIEWLQIKLNEHLKDKDGFIDLKVDGSFGDKVKFAIIKYYELQGWTSDGLNVGKFAIARLMK